MRSVRLRASVPLGTRAIQGSGATPPAKPLPKRTAHPKFADWLEELYRDGDALHKTFTTVWEHMGGPHERVDRETKARRWDTRVHSKLVLPWKFEEEEAFDATNLVARWEGLQPSLHPIRCFPARAP